MSRTFFALITLSFVLTSGCAQPEEDAINVLYKEGTSFSLLKGDSLYFDLGQDGESFCQPSLQGDWHECAILAPSGEYTLVWDDVEGYETPASEEFYFPSEKSVFFVGEYEALP